MRADAYTPEKDWRRVLIWAGLILAVSCLPYLIAWRAAPPGYQFGGILVNPYDGNSYLAKMRQGWAGMWQFHLAYTPEPHDGAYIFLFYLGLGHLARLLGAPLALVYHVARVAAGFALLLVVYAFLLRLSHDRHERRLAFWLAGTTAGLGWLGVTLGAFPIDLWVPEAFVFYSLLSNPHFPLAIALMLAIVGGVVWPRRGVWRWLAPGLLALALALVQPFALAVIYLGLALYLLLRRWLDESWPWPASVAAISVVLFSVPVLLYDYRVYTANPMLAAWSAQNLTPAPPVWDLGLGLGLVGLLAILGGVVVMRGRDRAGLALVSWSVVTLVLVYVPFALQRRFLTGLGLPLALLAAVGLARWLLPRLSPRRGRLLSIFTLVFSASGNVFLLAVLTAGALARQAQPQAFAQVYLSQDEAAAMEWLLEHGQDRVVLATTRTGMLLPGRAGVRVFVGHPFETVDFEVKQAQADAFFRGEMSAEEWREIQGQYSIDYVFVGPLEQSLGGGEDHLRGLEPAFRQGEVSIYHLD
ncbi:MAG: hypothetical protein Kow0063_22880 [Anaerolineae bacterium]